MFRTGIDTTCIEKEYAPLESFLKSSSSNGSKQVTNSSIPPKIVAKALLGASVTTQDPNFDEKYLSVVKETLKKHGLRQEKQIYKAAHLLKQIKGKFDDVFTDIFNAMESSISHIDLYHATYLHDNPLSDYVSIFGKAQGQRLTPLEYVEKNRNGFDQACTWWNWRMYSRQEPDQDHEYLIDNFDSKITPAWNELETNKVKMKVYYSGCECNCLISFADLILKEVDSFHFGPIDYVSIAQPLRNKAKNLCFESKN